MRLVKNKIKLREMFASEISVALMYVLRAEQVKKKKRKKDPGMQPCVHHDTTILPYHSEP